MRVLGEAKLRVFVNFDTGSSKFVSALALVTDILRDLLYKHSSYL